VVPPICRCAFMSEILSISLVTVLRRSSVSTADTVFANPRRDGHGRRCKHCQQSRASSRSRGGRLQSMPYGLPAALDSAVPQAYDPIAYLNAPKHSEWQEAPSARPAKMPFSAMA
jgi:hypothetical protein